MANKNKTNDVLPNQTGKGELPDQIPLTAKGRLVGRWVDSKEETSLDSIQANGIDSVTQFADDASDRIVIAQASTVPVVTSEAAAGAGAASTAATTTVTASGAAAAASTTAAVGAGIGTVGLVAGGVVAVAAIGGGKSSGAAAPAASPAADTTAPTVSHIAISGAAGSQNNTLNVGDVVHVTITMSEATTVTGTPHLALNIGGTTVQANYVSGSGTAALVFDYTITTNQTDANGISVDANSLSLNGGTLKDAAGNNAVLTHSVVADNASYMVDTAAPHIQSLEAHSATKTVVLTYNESLDSVHLPATTDFTVTTGGAANPVASIAVNGATMTLTLQNAFAAGAVTVTYTATAGDQVNAIQDLAGNDDDTGFSSGIVADGYVRGATVYIDTNNNGQADPGTDYLVGTTDANGNFFIPGGAPTGTIIAIGGVNIDTGVPNTAPLKAPAGSTTINPLTTLVQAVVDASGGTTDAATAASTVASTLGITLPAGTNLTSYDPIAAGNLAAQQAAAQIATVVALAEGDNSGAGSNVMTNLASQIQTASTVGDQVSLADASTLGTVLSGTGVSASAQSTIADASAAIGSAATLSAISSAQSQFLDTIAPAIPVAPDLAAASDTGSSNTDNLTKATTVTVRVNVNTIATDGTAAVSGDTVNLMDNGVQIGSVALSASDIGAGYVDMTVTGLAVGAHSFTAALTDQVGNTNGSSTPLAVTIDTSAPNVPTIATVAGDDVVNASEQTSAITGTAEANATVAIALGGNTRTVTANGSGSWTYTLTAADITAMGQGGEALSVTATDAAGNVSAASTRAISVDTLVPTTTVAITGADDNVSPATGNVVSGGATNDNTLGLSGSITGTLGGSEVVAIYDGSARIGTAVVNGSTWSFTTAGLSNSAHNFTARVEDAAGNHGAASTAYTVTVNASVPSATVSVTAISDGTTTIVGNTAINFNTPTLSGSITGSLSTGDQVIVYDGGVRLGAATVNGSSWSYTTPALGSGAHSFTAVVEASGGNQGAFSTPYAMGIDITAPNSPSIGTVAGDDVINAHETAAVICGTAEAGATVSLTLGSATRSVTADGAGNWSYTLTSSDLIAMGEGAQTLSAVATDNANNISIAGTRSIVIDTLAPNAPVIGAVATDNAISSAEKTNGVTITGTAEANAKIDLTVGGNIRSVTADGSGNWSYLLTAADYTAMGQGSQSLTATATDAAGNASSAGTKSITIDTVVPSLTPFTLVGASDSGVQGDGRSNVATPDIQFTAESGTTLEISIDGGPYASVGTGTGSQQTVTVSAIPGDGSHTISLRATDPAGNATVRSTTYILDTTAPSGPTLALAADTGSSSADHITKNGQVNVTGLEAGASWEYSTNGGSTWAAGSGSSVILTGDGAKSLIVRQTDVAGNVSVNSTLNFTLDTAATAPTLALVSDTGSSSTDGKTNLGTVNVSGLESGGTWEYSANGGSSWTTGSGSSVTLTGDGTKTLIVRQADAAGNVSPNSSGLSFTLDATAPSAPTLALASDTGSADGITSNGTINIGGLETGATWEYSTDGGTSWTTGSGNSVTLTGDGAKSLIVRQTDVVGNVSASSALDFTLDTTAPSQSVIDVLSDTGSSSTDNLSNVATPTVRVTFDSTAGPATAPQIGDVVKLYAGATLVGSVTLTTSNYGNFIDITTSNLGVDGTYSLTATVTDAAGNESIASASIDYKLDTVTTVAITSPNSTNSSTPTISGTAEVDDMLTVAVGGASYSVITTGGVWSLDLATATPDSGTMVLNQTGGNPVTVTATDVAGNTTTVIQTLSIDSVAPAMPTVAVVAASDTGNTADNISSDATPTVRVSFNTTATDGTAAAAGDTVKLYADATLVGSITLTTADIGHGYVDVTANGLGADGTYGLTAQITDVAGNSSTTSSAISYQLDATAPTTTVTIVGMSDDTGSNASDYITSTANQAIDYGLNFQLVSGERLMGSVDGGISWTDITGTLTGYTVGTWNVTLSPGTHSIQIKVMDTADNSGSVASQTYTLDTTAPVLQSAAVNGDQLVLTYSEALDPTQQPSSSYFQVVCNGGLATQSGRAIIDMSISGSTVTLTLSSPVANGDTVAINYLAPPSNSSYAIEDFAGNHAVASSSFTVTNNTSSVNSVVPSLVNATFTEVVNAKISLQFSEAMALGTTNNLHLLLNGPANDVTSHIIPGGVTVNGTIVTISTDLTLSATDVISVVYDGNGYLKDSSGTSFIAANMVIGGSGANTVDLSGLVSPYPFIIRTNGGADAITGFMGADRIISGGGPDTLDGSWGADKIYLTEPANSVGSDTVVVRNDGSNYVTGYDTVYGFDVTGTSTNDKLNLGSGTIAANTSGNVDGVDSGSLAQHSITGGIVTFKDVSGHAITINSSNLANASQYLDQNIAQVGAVVGFAYDSDNSGQADSLFVVENMGQVPQQIGYANFADTMVLLNGVNGVTLGNSPGQNVVQIQDTSGPMFNDNFAVAAGTGGDTIALSYHEGVFSATGDASGFAITKNGVAVGLTYVGVNGNQVTFQTDTTFGKYDVIGMDYTGASHNIKDAAGNFALGDHVVVGGSGNDTIDLSGYVGSNPSAELYGGQGNDTLYAPNNSASSNENNLSGGSGADTLYGNVGSDAFVFAQGDSPVVTFGDAGVTGLNDGDTFTFVGGQADVVANAGAGDAVALIQAGNPVAITNFLHSTTAPSNGLVTDQSYFTVRGDYSAGTATFAVNSSSGHDTLVVYDGDETANVVQTALVLSGVTSTTQLNNGLLVI